MALAQSVDHDTPPKARWIPALAYITFASPLYPIIALYTEWLLAWHALGHPPRLSADEPKFIDGSSWMHPVVELTLLAVVPMFFSSLMLNAYHEVERRDHSVFLTIRIFALCALWLGSLVFLAWDPWQVAVWWWD